MKDARIAMDNFQFGGAYFLCDVCGHRYRRWEMLTTWNNLRVDAECYDIRPPQMTPPNVFPEGLPFIDARTPQDEPDRLTDTTSIYAQGTTNGSQEAPDGRKLGPGALSPREITIDPHPENVNVLQDDITIIVGVVPPFSIPNPPTTNQ